MGRMHWLGFNTGVVISQRNMDARWFRAAR
jgi:hypothetical protein